MPNPRTIHLVASILPAAGAFLAADAIGVGGTAAYPSGPTPTGDNLTRLLFELIYVPASATGAPKFYIEGMTEGGVATRALVIDSALAIAGTIGSRSAYYDEIKLPVPPTGVGVAWTYHLTHQVERGLVGARLVVAEYGDTATPGTISAFASGGYG